MSKLWNKIIDYLVFPKGLSKLYNVLIILILMTLVYLVVYITGGTKYVYSHTMYIPIILATISNGIVGGLIAGIIGGILLGPLMPLDTSTNETQDFINWLYRLIIYTFVGIISGLAFNEFKKKTRQIINLITHHQETNIPSINLLNSNTLIKELDLGKIQYLISIVVNNHDNIIDLFSRKHFTELVKNIYQRIKFITPNESWIFQSETNRFWLCMSSNNIDLFIEKLLTALNDNFYINDIPIYVEISIGIVKYKQSDLLKEFKNADTASFYARKFNLQYLIYDPKLYKNSHNIELLGMFRDALYKEQIEIYYQPKIELKTQKTIGLEALLRWKHPELGWISPGKIIPLVEETHLINPLTEFVMKYSLQTLQKLKNKDISISINISAKNLQHPNFVKKICKLISEYNINPKKVELELTESTIMENISINKAILCKLREKDIQLSIDDFGTGYSSLAYISQLPIDIVKIDRDFINDLTKDDESQKIVKAIIDLVHNLGMKVLAEGVETQEIDTLLLEMNCDMAQGYYYAKPMNEEALLLWLEENN